MTSVLVDELTAKLSGPYRDAFRHLLEQSDEATEQYDRGNVETAFKILRADSSITADPASGLEKEQTLDIAWLALPATYQSGDMDPDY